jgi:hypothetical protein
MTTDEAIRALFPRGVILRAVRVVADPGVAVQPRLAASSAIEGRCRAFLEQLRWPEGVRCPRCDVSKGISRIDSRGQFECGACGYQFSVRVGTVFHASHLPLWKWFLAVYLISGSVERIRAAMKGDATPPLRMLTEGDVVARTRLGHKGKHLDAYRDEEFFHAKNRSNPFLFCDLLSRLIGVEAVPYAQLIASA